MGVLLVDGELNGAGDQAKWDDPDISRLLVSFVTYNERAQMFGLTQVNIAFFEWGSVYNKINSEVVSVQGYPSWGVIVTETLFVLVIMWMAYVEGKDMWHAARLGCGEFKDYWQFWNCVDWICIMLGISLITMWTACWAAMQAEGMRAILDEAVTGPLGGEGLGLGLEGSRRLPCSDLRAVRSSATRCECLVLRTELRSRGCERKMPFTPRFTNTLKDS
ncbi:unnamed protein product [Prorocentrum cordatum]|uniref:Ion transport domain-containing protein n=1 Tax=Prorocentrum cordatum TaxID=2364126 RepID=A0ABN9VZ58_9DINO|nr:unnamed protein product [Polarella glacialis]